MALDAIELVHLRLLEQGRGTCSDGRDWLRMVIGVLLSVTVGITIAVHYDYPFCILWAAFLGLPVTVKWIMYSDSKVRRQLIDELRNKLNNN